jgi:small subunit ribosomal protein S20
LKEFQKVIGGTTLANIKSQIKRNRQNKKRRDLNRVYRGRARTALKKARLAIEVGDVEKAREATQIATKALDKAAAKGVFHKNKAARQKSRLMQRFNSMG